jgi:hypothetical protein
LGENGAGGGGRRSIEEPLERLAQERLAFIERRARLRGSPQLSSPVILLCDSLCGRLGRSPSANGAAKADEPKE